MDKVKLTQEQADAIEAALSSDDFDRPCLLGTHWDIVTSRGSEEWTSFRALNELTFDQLATALYAGYEVMEHV